MKSRTTYWQNSFPNHLEMTFHLEELRLAGAFDLPDHDDPVVTEGKKAKACLVTFTRVGLPGTSAAAVKAKLDKFVGRDRDRWNPQKYNFVGYIWETGKRPLAGFAAMDIRVKKNAREQITDLTLDFKLMYIAKAHRGRGLGQMLAAAICVWLDHCKLSGVHVAKRGVSVLYYSEYESGGGVKCGDIVRDHFIYMQETRREMGADTDGWRCIWGGCRHRITVAMQHLGHCRGIANHLSPLLDQRPWRLPCPRALTPVQGYNHTQYNNFRAADVLGKIGAPSSSVGTADG